uniref:Cytochrome P450 n=1 Tax=Solanum tuberosum TaxID=4113 RepID=M1BZ95_SOLTU
MEGDIIDLLLQLKKEKSTPIDLTLDNIKAIIMNTNQRCKPETTPRDPCTRLTREHATASSQKPQRRLHGSNGDRRKAKSQRLLPQAGTILYSFSAILAAASSLGLWDGATLRPRTGESIRSVDSPFPLSELGKIAKKRFACGVGGKALLSSFRPDRCPRKDILDLLLQLKKEKSTPIDLTLEDAKALAMDVLVAGSDTRAAVIVWAMTALMRNPRAMKKVQAEIRQSIGKKGIVNEDDIQNMSYLKAVIKETLRLYPSAPLLLPRESMKKSRLEEYEIESGTTIYVNFWAIARDPEIWENSNEYS